ncbi:hypothetical protein ABE10_25410, partial [Bacillus toyonensis]|nr:hypothetical protein [Bacillus toyonensis]
MRGAESGRRGRRLRVVRSARIGSHSSIRRGRVYAVETIGRATSAPEVAAEASDRSVDIRGAFGVSEDGLLREDHVGVVGGDALRQDRQGGCQAGEDRGHDRASGGEGDTGPEVAGGTDRDGTDGEGGGEGL